MDVLLRQLNDEQRECVLHRAPVLQILAGPGSGKTRVLTVRIALAIIQHGIRPEWIVVVTFTNKAAKELKERLAILVGPEISRRLLVGTFHSIALRFLQRFGTNLGLSKKLSVADSSESKNVVSKVLKALRKGIIKSGHNDESTEKQLTASTALSYISTLKSNGITVDMFGSIMLSKSCPISLGTDHKLELHLVYEEYQAHLASHDLLDFDDLILRAIELLRAFPLSVSNVEHVFVDEFQDTSAQQYELMKLLAQSKRNLTIVGDHDQSIYGFRAADIKNFEKMRDHYPTCVEFHLKQNYRSSGAIVFLASTLIEQDSMRPKKDLETQNGVGPHPTLRCLQSAKSEADWLAKEITRLLNHTEQVVRSQDIAILVRSASLTLPVEQALQRNQIKYRLTNARKFLERPHIRNIVNYLRVIHDERSLALLEIINVPGRRFGQTSIENLQTKASEIHKNLWQTMRLVARGSILLSKKRDPTMESKLWPLVKLIDALRTEAATMTIEGCMAALITRLIDGIKYEAYLKVQYPEDYSERLEDVREFMQTSDVLAEMSDDATLPSDDGLSQNEVEQTPLDRLIAALSLMSDSGTGSEDNAHMVTISTIHSAKGLEWPVVFIPGVYHGSIPSARSMDTEQDEERRLLYVAMTRAQALLYLSYPLKNARYESVQPSSFITHSNMTPLFEERGPRITLHMVKELAKILNRPPPTESRMTISVDDYQDKTEAQLADEDYDLAFKNGKFVKRKREEVPDDGIRIGFSSAGQVLRHMSEHDLDGRDNTPVANKPPAKDKKKQQQQKGIKAYFAPTAPSSALRRSASESAATTVQTGFDDYRTVYLSSSPERDDGKKNSKLTRQMTAPDTSMSTTYVQYSTISQPLYNSSNIGTKPKKRLGMSRPRLLPKK